MVKLGKSKKSQIFEREYHRLHNDYYQRDNTFIYLHFIRIKKIDVLVNISSGYIKNRDYQI